MELIFIRHGYGEHLLEYPNRLNTLHPGLTDYGRMQVNQLKEHINILSNDLIIVSPTKRTIETAQLLTQSFNFYVSPFVGPRMFPQNPELPFLLCDQAYTKEEVIDLYPETLILDFDLKNWGEGINRINQEVFENYANRLLDWSRDNERRTIIISHDGTITNYRIFLGEKGLTREDFLGEAGTYTSSY